MIDKAKIEKAQRNLAQKLWADDYPNEPFPQDDRATPYLDEAIQMMIDAPALIEGWNG